LIIWIAVGIVAIAVLGWLLGPRGGGSGAGRLDGAAAWARLARHHRPQRAGSATAAGRTARAARWPSSARSSPRRNSSAATASSSPRRSASRSRPSPACWCSAGRDTTTNCTRSWCTRPRSGSRTNSRTSGCRRATPAHPVRRGLGGEPHHPLVGGRHRGRAGAGRGIQRRIARVCALPRCRGTRPRQTPAPARARSTDAWASDLAAEFDALLDAVDRGEGHLPRPVRRRGRSGVLCRGHRGLPRAAGRAARGAPWTYGLLREFYGLDPASWAPPREG